MNFEEYLQEVSDEEDVYIKLLKRAMKSDNYTTKSVLTYLRKKDGKDWWKKYQNKKEKDIIKIFQDIEEKEKW